MFPYGGRAKEPKTAPCPRCAEPLELTDSFTNQCASEDCGQYTDGQGNPIRPPSEWEEPWDDD